MENISNYILIVMFAAIAVWLFRGYFKTRGLVYKDKFWTTYRILFVAAGALCLLTSLVYTTWIDFVRLGLMLLCVVGFLLVRDGIGEEGIAVSGRMYPWAKIRAWDYAEHKKSLRIYAQTTDGDAPIVSMPLEKKDEILAYMREKAGKKYTRLKKGN